MTVAGGTVPLSRKPAPFTRWPPLAASALGCLALAVVAATFPLGSMAGQLTAQTVASSLVALAFAAVAVSTLAAAAAFNPVRRWVQHLVDRRFNRARYDADLIVAAFATRLQDSTDPGQATADLGDTVQQALEPAHLSLWIAEVAS